VVIVPWTASTQSIHPIVAWAHPTTGVVPRYAPSLANFQFQQISGLRQFIDRGYVVAATDYQGLGTQGPHPFLVGESEGRAVLDMVRATKVLLGQDAGRQVALWGHSQGGQAVLFAASLAPSYAPELHIDAVATAAPATNLGRLMKDDLGTSGSDNLFAMALWS
jgi:alpha-beta hydrolase superfamily lysophospholipase